MCGERNEKRGHQPKHRERTVCVEIEELSKENSGLTVSTGHKRGKLLCPLRGDNRKERENE